MPKYYYKLLTKNNQVKDGYITAVSKKSAEKKLTRDGSMVVSLTNEYPSFLQRSFSFSRAGFSATEKINFFHNLYTMSGAGISIVESLEVAGDQLKNKKLKMAISTMVQDTRNGQKLSKSMAKFPQYFSEYLIETINMGELSGRLTEIFSRIAIDLEKDEEIRRKVQGALMYPMIVITLMILAASILVIYVLPGIKEIYAQFNAPLPLPTKLLLSTSVFLKENIIFLPGVIIGIVVLFLIFLKNKKLRYVMHYFTLKIPIFGNFIKDYNLVLFFRSLKSLIESGVSIVDAVRVAKNTTKNDVYKKTLNKVEPILFHGVSFADTLLPYPFLFSTQTQKILKIGEQAGKMDETLGRIAEYYERSVDYKNRMMLVIIEPVLLVILGVVVGGLALSIFLPLYTLIKFV